MEDNKATGSVPGTPTPGVDTPLGNDKLADQGVPKTTAPTPGQNVGQANPNTTPVNSTPEPAKTQENPGLNVQTPPSESNDTAKGAAPSPEAPVASPEALEKTANVSDGASEDKPKDEPKKEWAGNHSVGEA